MELQRRVLSPNSLQGGVSVSLWVPGSLGRSQPLPDTEPCGQLCLPTSTGKCHPLRALETYSQYLEMESRVPVTGCFMGFVFNA